MSLMLARRAVVRSPSFRGLLDDYPGAAAAYSLRPLSAAWRTQPVVRVRRSNDDAEADFTAAEVADGTLTGWTGANDGFVVTWYDQSGEGRNATQATPANQPRIVAGGVVETLNGKPSIYSPGEKNLNTGIIDLGVSGDVSLDFFAVMQNDSQGQNSHLLGLTLNDTIQDRRRIFFLANDSSNRRSVRLYGGNVIYNSDAVGQIICSINYQGGGGELGCELNGSVLNVESLSNSGLNIQQNSGFILLSGRSTTTGGGVELESIDPGCIGHLQEALFYLDDESSARAAIESNINAHYGIYTP
jgi:hypothetical protein